jgi:hypothetical protein
VETPPPDPDGRPYVWLDFHAHGMREVHLGLGGSLGSIKRQGLRLAEGMPIVVFDEYDEDEWMLADAWVLQFDSERSNWLARVDWSTLRRVPRVVAPPPS